MSKRTIRSQPTLAPLRVFMQPDPAGITSPTNGIDQAVLAYGKYLPEFGIEFVRQGEPADLTVVHAGCGPDADIAQLHGLYWSADYQAERWEWAANANVLANARRALVVTVPSAWVAETFQRDFRIQPEIVGHGVEWADWQADVPNEGYVLWNKNRPSDVCSPEAVRQLARALPDQQFITTFGEARPNVRVTGLLPFGEMRDLVLRAGVYLATTKETFGIGTLEALAAGVPVLGWRYGGTAELVKHWATGYLAEPGDWGNLHNGLTYCLAQRATLSAAAREAAKAYAWRPICERLAGIFRRAWALKQAPATVAVVIPTYNHAGEVGRALASALAQTLPPTEIVIVDDGSTDNTPDVVQALVAGLPAGAPPVHYLRQANGGVATARNAGVAATRAKYVCPLDADDEIASAFLQICVAALEADPALGIAYTGITPISPDGVAGPVSEWPGDCDPARQAQGQNQIPTCAVLRRSIWTRLGGQRQRYAPQGAGSEDAEFWLRALAYGATAKKVSTGGLFFYHFGGMVSTGQWKGAPWLGWHPWVHDRQYPCAAVMPPADAKLSQPVRQYDRPVVSVIIPVGPGHAPYLADALDSLEAQTLRQWEAIVVNDSGASLDLTAYPYVRLVELAGGSGAGKARNAGLALCRANLIGLLDADDYLQPPALAKWVTALRDPPVSWVYADCHILHEDKRIELYPAQDFAIEPLFHSGLAGVTGVYRKVAWQAVGGFDEESSREDWDFHFRLAAGGWCGLRIAEPLWAYRHATGTRRNADGLAAEVQRLRNKYPREALQMACGSCGKRVAKPAPVAASGDNAALRGLAGLGEEFVTVEYTGLNRADVIYTGTRGGRYAFGNNDAHRVQRVPAADVPNLLRLAVFRRVDAAPPPPQAQAPAW